MSDDIYINIDDEQPKPVDVVQVEFDKQDVYIDVQQDYAPVLAVNGQVGYVNLTPENLGLNNIVYTSGNQNIGGVKTFASRPTVNGTGVLLSGEATSLPKTIVYTTGTQTISGYKNFNEGLQYKNYEVATLNDVTGYQKKNATGIFYVISNPRYLNNSIGGYGGIMNPRVSGYFYQVSEKKYIKMGPTITDTLNPTDLGGTNIWMEYDLNNQLQILYKQFENDTPYALYRSTQPLTNPSNGSLFKPWDSIVEWESVSSWPYTGLPIGYQSQDFENVINFQSSIISNLPSTTNVVQEYRVSTPYQTTPINGIGGYGFQLTKDTKAPTNGYDSWMMLKDTIYSRSYNDTPIPLSAVFTQLLEFTSSVPQSSTSIGSRGAVAYDGTYLYICVNTNVWTRVAISNW